MILIVLPDLTDDQDLLHALRADSPEVVQAVYERFFPPLYNYTRLKVGDARLAVDIVAVIFVKLLRVVGTHSAPRQSLRGWLFQVARHEIARMVGRNARMNVIALEEWMPDPTQPNPEATLSASLDTEHVRQAVLTLKPDHQEVIVLRFGQHLSLQETADIMGKSVSAIKSLQFRALDNLRAILLRGASHA
jgi:RNA polymerase sigma-70 factor (ECF subfamily)